MRPTEAVKETRRIDMNRRPNIPSLAAFVFAAAAVVAPPAAAQTGYTYVPVTPCRAVDTRYGYGGALVGGVQRTFQIKGVCGVPTSAVAVTMNMTVVGPTAGGFVTVWPVGYGFPGVSNINFNAGEPAIANGVVVGLGTGSPDLYAIYGSGGGGTLHLILDVTGYYK
jgi:hypothetical protein